MPRLASTVMAHLAAPFTYIVKLLLSELLGLVQDNLDKLVPVDIVLELRVLLNVDGLEGDRIGVLGQLPVGLLSVE